MNGGAVWIIAIFAGFFGLCIVRAILTYFRVEVYLQSDEYTGSRSKGFWKKLGIPISLFFVWIWGTCTRCVRCRERRDGGRIVDIPPAPLYSVVAVPPIVDQNTTRTQGTQRGNVDTWLDSTPPPPYTPFDPEAAQPVPPVTSDPSGIASATQVHDADTSPTDANAMDPSPADTNTSPTDANAVNPSPPNTNTNASPSAPVTSSEVPLRNPYWRPEHPLEQVVTPSTWGSDSGPDSGPDSS